MNGDDRKLAVDLFDMWRSQHDDMAQEVRDDVKEIKEKVGKLPCKVHIERMKHHTIGLTGLYIIVGYMVYNLISNFLGGK